MKSECWIRLHSSIVLPCFLLLQAQRPATMNFNRDRRPKYQHPKGAPDADLIFGPKKIRWSEPTVFNISSSPKLEIFGLLHEQSLMLLALFCKNLPAYWSCDDLMIKYICKNCDGILFKWDSCLQLFNWIYWL